MQVKKNPKNKTKTQKTNNINIKSFAKDKSKLCYLSNSKARRLKSKTKFQ